MEQGNSDEKTIEAQQYLMLLKQKLEFLKNDYRSFDVRKVQPDYYDLELSERRAILNAPSEEFLCKSIIMENTEFKPEFEDSFYQKYYLIIIQYVTKINADKVMKFLKDYQNKHSSQKIGRKAFHFRLVPDELSAEITGFTHNGVTPFLIKKRLPVIISDRITKLTPKCFWLGGGEVDVKIRISFSEFLSKYGGEVHVADVVYDE